jgi:TRAP-type uncharacterized transport system substrate-binding protein
MFRWSHWDVIRGLAALIALGVVIWLALEYFVPSLPTRITIGAGVKGTTFEYFAERYRQRFARAGINLDVRETAGALENLELLKDPSSGVQIGFLTGGISNGENAPNLSSMGLISNIPFWIFYPSYESLTGLSQLKGKRIAVGPEGSGARYTAERLLSRADINAQTATLLPFQGMLQLKRS